MYPDQRFLLRFGLALLGMLALVLFVFVGLGWVVSRQPSWLLRVMDDNNRNLLWTWYAQASDGLAPWDSDGDGFSDGLELFMGSDPHNPKNSPPFQTFDVSCTHIDQRASFIGEWQHIILRAKVGVTDFRVVPGTLLEISSPPRIMHFRQHAGDPAVATLPIRIGADGILEFDFTFDAAIDLASRISAPLVATDPRNGKAFDPVTWGAVIAGWRGTAIPATFCDKSGTPITPRNDSKRYSYPDDIYVKPPLSAEQACGYELEGHHKNPSWRPCYRTLYRTDANSLYHLGEWWLDYMGTCVADYDWSITPILKAPPAAGSPEK